MSKLVQHVVLETQDGLFTVEYICMITGRTRITQYECPLTKREIEAEYDYIHFPVNKQPDSMPRVIGKIDLPEAPKKVKYVCDDCGDELNYLFGEIGY